MTPPEEKDRFGDKLRDVEKAREDKFFAERDAKLLAKLKAAKSGDEERTLKELALARCPKCGTRLVTRKHLDVTLEECPTCRGMWLEKGEMEQLAQREKHGWLARYLGLGE